MTAKFSPAQEIAPEKPSVFAAYFARPGYAMHFWALRRRNLIYSDRP
jgi:hypothetical protein